MRRLGNQPHALIEALHTVQESFDYLDADWLRFVATSLRVPVSQAYGVETFYHYFTLKPSGKHTCVVCTGTACYIKGAGKLLSEMENKYGLSPVRPLRMAIFRCSRRAAWGRADPRPPRSSMGRWRGR